MSDQLNLFGVGVASPATVVARPKLPPPSTPHPGQVQAVRETFAGEIFGLNGERLPDGTRLGEYASPADERPAPSPIAMAPVEPLVTEPSPPPPPQCSPSPADGVDPAHVAYVIHLVPLNDHECEPAIRIRTLLKQALREYRLRNVRAVMVDRRTLGADAAEVSS